MLLVLSPQKAASAASAQGMAESEVDYRGQITSYLTAKRNRYIKKDNLSVLDATLLALRKAKNKIADFNRDDLRLYLVHALHEVWYGNEKAYLDLSIHTHDGLVPNISFTVCTKNREHCKFLNKDADTLEVYLECVPTEIPSMGRYLLSVHSDTLGVKKKFGEMYDLHEIHKLKNSLREGTVKNVVMKIPCYAQEVATKAANNGLPLTEIHLMIKVGYEESLAKTRNGDIVLTKDLKCTIVGAKIMCILQGDPHHVLYTNRVHLDDNPTFDHGRALRQAALTDKILSSSRATTSTYSQVASHSGITSSINQVLADFMLRACADKKGASVTAPIFSWSVSHGDQVVLSHKGLDRHPIGHVGEVLFGLATIRAANGCSPSAWSDMNLCTPQGLEKLLIKSGSKAVHAALKTLYTGCSRLPSVLELLTHTSGLPHLGSVDCEVDAKFLESILPGRTSGDLPEDREERFARMLRDRVTLIAEPGSVVHHSVLGYAILTFCFSNLNQSMKAIYSELGMNSTRLERVDDKNLDQDSLVHPDDDTYHVSNCTISTTNDLCHYIAAIEKANQDPCAYPYLAHSLVPCYLYQDHGKGGMQAICNGGMESCMLKIDLREWCNSTKKSEKVSLNVFFKFGERQGQSSSIIVWIPGLHVGFSMCSNISLKTLFGKSHKEMGYHKRDPKKIFTAKHLIKCMLHKVLSALSQERGGASLNLDQEADIAYSVTPKLPPRYREYVSKCNAATDGPLDGTFKTLLESSPLFKGEGVYFYPMIHAMHEIKRQVYGVSASVHVPDERITEKLERIRMFRKAVGGGGAGAGKETYYFLEDSQSGQCVQLAWDKTFETKCGTEAATALNLHTGAFRKVSTYKSGDLEEHVSIHVLPEKILGIHHRGCLYISHKALKDMKAIIYNHRMSQEESVTRSTRKEEAEKFFPWKLVEDSIQTIPQNPAHPGSPHQQQQSIERGFGGGGWHGGGGGAFAAGVLGGAALGTAAAVGAGVVGPYGYYGYPPGPYPYGYYRRRYPYYW